MTENDWWASLEAEWMQSRDWDIATLRAFSDWLEEHHPAEAGLILALRWMVAASRRPRVSFTGRQVAWLRQHNRAKGAVKRNSLPGVLYDAYSSRNAWEFRRVVSGQSPMRQAVTKLARAFERVLLPLGLLKVQHIEKLKG